MYSAIESLLSSEEFKLPYSSLDDSKSSKFYFEEKVKSYRNQIFQLKNSNDFHAILEDEFIYDLDEVISLLLICFNSYLEGHPAKAFHTFDVIMKMPKVYSQLVNFRTVKINPNHKFYRLKKEYNSKLKFDELKYEGISEHTSPLEAFHVPFNKRKSIGTNRFSIPGFPCLYLSDTILTSWSEIADSRNIDFHAICFKNLRPLYLIDLVPLNHSIPQITIENISKLYDHNNNEKFLLDYLLIYPIILACHCKLKYIPEYPGQIQFKSEYIVPQLMMQWFKNSEKMVDGIRYLSCTAFDSGISENDNFYNYVIPAIDSEKEEGYCDELSSLFSVSEVYSNIGKLKNVNGSSLIAISEKISNSHFKCVASLL
jgi:hypothetical protein